MIRSGILTEDDPVELLEGILVPKVTKNPRHRACTRRVRLALERLLPANWYVDTQEPVTLADSEPEPDVCVTRVDTGATVDRHPGAAEIGLVVEVADATLTSDRTTKKRVYAGARVPYYWIVNLLADQIEVFSEPTGSGAAPAYRSQAIFGLDETVPVVLDGREVGSLGVSELIPPAEGR
jgi:Uma2 family endonuclease